MLVEEAQCYDMCAVRNELSSTVLHVPTYPSSTEKYRAPMVARVKNTEHPWLLGKKYRAPMVARVKNTVHPWHGCRMHGCGWCWC
jgi:hypothetical protein